MKQQLNVAVIGATGLVGQEVIGLLIDRAFPCTSIRAFASSNSEGDTLSHKYKGRNLVVQGFYPAVAHDIDVTFLAVRSDIAKDIVRVVHRQSPGCMIFDKSSAHRESHPLVIPEINPSLITPESRLIASPNCMTAIMLMGLFPLHLAFGLKRLVVATEQSVSGAGARELEKFENGVSFCNHNVVPYVGAFRFQDEDTEEEEKLAKETRLILGLPGLPIIATCTRVPVRRGHSAVVHAEFEKPILNLESARGAINNFGGSNSHCVGVADNARAGTPAALVSKEQCLVSRLRIDPTCNRRLTFFVAGDNLWRGAALNAILTAELFLKKFARHLMPL